MECRLEMEMGTGEKRRGEKGNGVDFFPQVGNEAI